MNFDEYKDQFQTETTELLNLYEDTLLNMQEGKQNPKDIESLFRCAHTIKGSASMFGMDTISECSHSLENVIQKVRDGELSLSKDIIDFFLLSKDYLTELVEHCVQEKEPTQAMKEKKELLKEELYSLISTQNSQAVQHGNISNDDLPQEQSQEDIVNQAIEEQNKQEVQEKAQEKQTIKFTISCDNKTFTQEPIAFFYDLKKQFDIISIEVSTKDLLDLSSLQTDIFYLFYEVELIAKKHELDLFLQKIEKSAKITMGEDIIQGSDINHSPQKPQIQTDTPDLTPVIQEKPKQTAPQATKKPTPKKSSPSIRVGDYLRVKSTKIDQMIDVIGQMVIENSKLANHINKTQDEEMLESFDVLSRMIDTIRQDTMDVRMIQVGETFSRFNRLVHELKGDKDIVLQIEGKETEIDKTVMEKIIDPITHILRNAIDHGIETPEQRIANNKPLRSTIVLSALTDGTNIVVSISDDGKGIDLDAIKDKAITQGVDVDDMDDKELTQLLFESGFSTAKEITAISGRGFGMDIVRKNIEALRGFVEVKSKKNFGTTISMHLPLTLAISGGFLCACGDIFFVVPIEFVQECLDYEAPHDRHTQFALRKEILPLVELGDLFDIEQKTRKNILILSHKKERFAIVVDELLGEFSFVIKPLGRLYRRLTGINAATILGSGTLALILDVPGLISIARKKTKK